MSGSRASSCSRKRATTRKMYVLCTRAPMGALARVTWLCVLYYQLWLRAANEGHTTIHGGHLVRVRVRVRVRVSIRIRVRARAANEGQSPTTNVAADEAAAGGSQIIV